MDSWTEFEGENRIGDHSIIYQSRIGFGSYMGNGCKFIKTDIGKYSSIASGVCVVTGVHPVSEYISTSPVFYSALFGGRNTYVEKEYFPVYKYSDEKNHFVCIGNDVWIGEGVKILQGVTIGDGVVVGAYSVVTKNLEPYGVYAGVPAKLIKYRFDHRWVKELENFKWWNRDEEWIQGHVDIFKNHKAFFADILMEVRKIND